MRPYRTGSDLHLQFAVFCILVVLVIVAVTVGIVAVASYLK
jgi:hypothetical protein